MLGLVLYMTISTVKLWFADFDPYRTIFGLGWLFEFNAVEQWPAYGIALAILVASFFIPRFWCKYTCPLGGALSLLSHFSLLRIRRTAATCKSCALCSVPCPVGIAVEEASPLVSTNCIGCLACVDTCPRHGALEVAFMPATWLAYAAQSVSSPPCGCSTGRRPVVRINRFFVPILAVGLLLGTVWVAQASGWWLVSGKELVDVANLQSSADIRGWMTFQQLSDGYAIELQTLYRLVGVQPDLPPETALKDMESVVPGFEMETVREVVAVYLGEEVVEEAIGAVTTPMPAVTDDQAAMPSPAAMPTVTPTVVHEPKGEASALGSTGSGDPAATVEIKGRQTLQEVADQAELPLADLIAGLDLPADTDASQPLRDLVAGGVLDSIDTVRIAVAGLQPD